MWFLVVAGLGLLHCGLCQNRENPCNVRSGLTPHETYCDKYYQCIDEQVLEFDCPNGLVYAGKGRGLLAPCDYEYNIDCIDRPNRNAAIQTNHCDWLYGIFGHETSCTRYWSCWNGTSTELYCVGGLLFNEETHSCDWPQFVAGCQQHPLCADNPNGNVPLGKSCERYWKCLGGYPRLQRCPAGLVFDKIALRCTNPPTEDCDVPTTTPPPPEEDEVIGGGLQNIGGGQGGRPRGRPQNRRPQQQQQQFEERRPQQQQFEERRQQPQFDDGPRNQPQRGPLPQQFVPEGAIPLNK